MRLAFQSVIKFFYEVVVFLRLDAAEKKFEWNDNLKYKTLDGLFLIFRGLRAEEGEFHRVRKIENSKYRDINIKPFLSNVVSAHLRGIKLHVRWFTRFKKVLELDYWCPYGRKLICTTTESWNWWVRLLLNGRSRCTVNLTLCVDMWRQRSDATKGRTSKTAN